VCCALPPVINAPLIEFYPVKPFEVILAALLYVLIWKGIYVNDISC